MITTRFSHFRIFFRFSPNSIIYFPGGEWQNVTLKRGEDPRPEGSGKSQEIMFPLFRKHQGDTEGFRRGMVHFKLHPTILEVVFDRFKVTQGMLLVNRENVVLVCGEAASTPLPNEWLDIISRNPSSKAKSDLDFFRISCKGLGSILWSHSRF